MPPENDKSNVDNLMSFTYSYGISVGNEVLPWHSPEPLYADDFCEYCAGVPYCSSSCNSGVSMLFSLSIIFLAGISFGMLVSKLRSPSLIGMIFAGILIGPYLLNLLDASTLDIAADLRRFALAVILTRAGLALDLEELKQVGRPAMLLCFVPATCEIAGCVLIAPSLLGLAPLESAILGTVVAAVSPAVVVPRMLGLINKGYGSKQGIPQMIMAAASVDDVFVLVLFTAFTGLAATGKFSPFMFMSIPISIVCGILLGCLAGMALACLYGRTKLTAPYKTLIHLSVAFLMMAAEHFLAGVVPVSGLLATMSMSILVAKKEPKQAHELSLSFSAIWSGAEILLFVLVGATVDPAYVKAAGLAALLVIFGALAFRMAGVGGSLVGTRMEKKERLFCMIAYTPKATVQAAIGSLPLAMGLSCGHIVLTVAVLSILLTAPLGAYGIDMTYKKLLRPARNGANQREYPDSMV